MWHCHKNETVRNRNFLIFHFWGKNEYMLLTCILVFKLALKVHNELEFGFLNFVRISEFWNFVRTTEFGTSWEQPNFGCSHEVEFLAFWPWKWPLRSSMTSDLKSMAFIGYMDQFSEVRLAVLGFFLNIRRRRWNGQILDLLGFAAGKNHSR